MAKSIRKYTDKELIDHLCYLARVSSLSKNSCEILDQASERLRILSRDFGKDYSTSLANALSEI